MSDRGAPTVMTEKVVRLLVQSLQDGLNVSQACWQSGITRDTYYNHYNNNPEFSDRMDRARAFPSMNSRKGIVKAIKDGDIHSMRWWLEHRDKDEFSTRQELTGRKGQPLVQTLSTEEKARIDEALKAKVDKEVPSETDRSTDPGTGGAESESVS